MSEVSNLGNGLNSLSPSLGQFDARMQAAQMGRLDGQLKEAAGALGQAQQAGKSGAMDPKEAARLQKVSKDFESIFLAYMLKTMRSSVDKSKGLLDENQGEQIFGEMRDEELAKGMSAAGGIGLSRLLVDQLKQSLGSKKA